MTDQPTPEQLDPAGGGEWINFNLNDCVRVKLTDAAVGILRADYERLMGRLTDRHPFVEPKRDADGWTEYQLWGLMQDFGPHIRLGVIPPLETTIQFRLARHP